MLSLWNPYGEFGFGNLRRTLSVMDELHRQMGSLLSTAPHRDEDAYRGLPNTYFRDTGDQFVIRADVPGLSEKDVEVTITGDTLSIRGQRTLEVPEGYSVHRQERCEFRFSRSFNLPTKVDAEKAKATVKNGVFELVLPKAAEAQPRKISVKSN